MGLPARRVHQDLSPARKISRRRRAKQYRAVMEWVKSVQAGKPRSLAALVMERGVSLKGLTDLLKEERISRMVNEALAAATQAGLGLAIGELLGRLSDEETSTIDVVRISDHFAKLHHGKYRPRAESDKGAQVAVMINIPQGFQDDPKLVQQAQVEAEDVFGEDLQ